MHDSFKELSLAQQKNGFKNPAGFSGKVLKVGLPNLISQQSWFYVRFTVYH